MEQKCNSIFFARGPHFPMKALENLRAVGVGATVAQGWMICSVLEQHRWMDGLLNSPCFGSLYYSSGLLYDGIFRLCLTPA